MKGEIPVSVRMNPSAASAGKAEASKNTIMERLVRHEREAP